MEQIKSIFVTTFYFVFIKKKVLLMHTELFETYGKNIIAIKTCANWFKRFKNSDFDISDKECSGCNYRIG